ncbi:hypothetical protein C8R47DRAFT_1065156 [Mycena vitilis]|nr:hypothetical protein C8R47DRAFT_1065156 [Mycena vitilis]
MVLLRAVTLAVSTLLPCAPLVVKSLRTFRTIERLEISTGWNEESERISAAVPQTSGPAMDSLQLVRGPATTSNSLSTSQAPQNARAGYCRSYSAHPGVRDPFCRSTYE